MQSLACFANRHYAFAKHLCRLPIRINTREYTIFNRRQPNVVGEDPRRLWYPVAEFFYNRLRRELIGLRNLFLDHGPGRTKHLARLCNRRRFFTGPPRRNNKENGNKNNPNKDPNPKRDPKKDGVESGVLLQKIVMLLALLFGLLMYLGRADQTQKLKEITTTSWNEFVYHMLAKGEVESVDIDSTANLVVINLHPYAVIKGKRTLFRRYLMSVPDVNNVEQKIREAEQNLGIAPGEAVPINFIRRGEHAVNAIRFLTTLLFGALILYLFGMNSRLINPSNIFENLTKAKYTLVEPFTGKGVRFDDVAGLKNAKVEVMEFVDYLKNPTRYRSLGAKMPKGVLLLGPPGCGKTMLAKAVATESNVPFLSMNGSEFIEMLGGLGAARVRHLFKEGKKRAPSIIYIDEIDAIGKKRFEAGPGGSESDRTLNQLLVEMDGMATNANVIVLASTNRDEVLDKALLRPGRFDRQITIEMPTHEERKQIFETHLKSVVLKGTPENYSDYLASFTPGFSGADIANVCNEAALHAARYQKTMVDQSDLIYAIDRVVGGMVKKTAHTPDMKKSIAYYEAGRAVVGWLSQNADPILKVSIVPRTNKKHGFTQSELSEAYLYSKEHIFDKICMLLGGRVAEHVMLNKTSEAAKDDLKRVTKLAYDQVKHYGMSNAVGLVSFVDQRGQITIKGRRPYSKRLGNLIDAEVNKIVDEAYKRTKKLLLENKDKVTAVAEALIERETLLHEDIEKLIGPPVHGKKPRVLLSKLDTGTEAVAAETSA